MIMQETKHDFDVAILGNGLSGSMRLDAIAEALLRRREARMISR